MISTSLLGLRHQLQQAVDHGVLRLFGRLGVGGDLAGLVDQQHRGRPGPGRQPQVGRFRQRAVGVLAAVGAGTSELNAQCASPASMAAGLRRARLARQGLPPVGGGGLERVDFRLPVISDCTG